jgi:hypothetical protein
MKWRETPAPEGKMNKKRPRPTLEDAPAKVQRPISAKSAARLAKRLAKKNTRGVYYLFKSCEAASFQIARVIGPNGEHIFPPRTPCIWGQAHAVREIWRARVRAWKPPVSDGDFEILAFLAGNLAAKDLWADVAAWRFWLDDRTDADAETRARAERALTIVSEALAKKSGPFRRDYKKRLVWEQHKAAAVAAAVETQGEEG